MIKTWKSHTCILISIALLLLAVPLFLGFSGCVSFTMRDKEIARAFLEAELHEPDYRKIPIPGEDANLFFARAGNPQGRPLVFVHGSPGSWDNFLHFFLQPELRESFNIIAPDRPGFGKTRPDSPEPSMDRQAAILSPTLEKSPLPAILIGHSLGGPVAAQMAIDYPDRVAGLILIAPSISPALEDPRWYNRLADSAPVRWFLPRPLKHSNDEIMPLKGELTGMEDATAVLTLPVIVIQGDKDSLVPPENAAYVKQHFQRAKTDIRTYPDLNHFIPWTRPDLITEAIRDMEQSLSGGDDF